MLIQKGCAILLCMHEISGSGEVGEECVCMWGRGMYIRLGDVQLLVAACKCACYMYVCVTAAIDPSFYGYQPLLQNEVANLLVPRPVHDSSCLLANVKLEGNNIRLTSWIQKARSYTMPSKLP